MATANVARQDTPLMRKLGRALSGEIRGIPVAVIVMMLAGAAAGGVAAVTTHAFETTSAIAAPAHLGPLPRN